MDSEFNSSLEDDSCQPVLSGRENPIEFTLHPGEVKCFEISIDVGEAILVPQETLGIVAFLSYSGEIKNSLVFLTENISHILHDEIEGEKFTTAMLETSNSTSNLFKFTLAETITESQVISFSWIGRIETPVSSNISTIPPNFCRHYKLIPTVVDVNLFIAQLLLNPNGLDNIKLFMNINDFATPYRHLDDIETRESYFIIDGVKVVQLDTSRKVNNEIVSFWIENIGNTYVTYHPDVSLTQDIDFQFRETAIPHIPTGRSIFLYYTKERLFQKIAEVKEDLNVYHMIELETVIEGKYSGHHTALYLATNRYPTFLDNNIGSERALYETHDNNTLMISRLPYRSIKEVLNPSEDIYRVKLYSSYISENFHTKVISNFVIPNTINGEGVIEMDCNSRWSILNITSSTPKIYMVTITPVSSRQGLLNLYLNSNNETFPFNENNQFEFFRDDEETYIKTCVEVHSELLYISFYNHHRASVKVRVEVKEIDVCPDMHSSPGTSATSIILIVVVCLLLLALVIALFYTFRNPSPTVYLTPSEEEAERMKSMPVENQFLLGRNPVDFAKIPYVKRNDQLVQSFDNLEEEDD